MKLKLSPDQQAADIIARAEESNNLKEVEQLAAKATTLLPALEAKLVQLRREENELRRLIADLNYVIHRRNELVIAEK